MPATKPASTTRKTAAEKAPAKSTTATKAATKKAAPVEVNEPAVEAPAAAKKKTAAPVAAVSQEQIAVSAYLRWESRGCPIGEDLQDWLAAEYELAGSRS